MMTWLMLTQFHRWKSVYSRGKKRIITVYEATDIGGAYPAVIPMDIHLDFRYLGFVASGSRRVGHVSFSVNIHDLQGLVDDMR